MAQASFGQILDTTDAHRYKPLEVSTYDEFDILNLELDSQRIDTTLNDFYDYYTAYKSYFPFLDLGLEGSPVLDLTKTNERELNLQFGNSLVAPYLIDDTINIYNTDNPFTRVNYSQGSNELISIEVTHAQKISERLFFGVDYNRLKNQNFYFSDIQDVDRVRMNNLFNTKFYTAYFSKNRNYEILFSYVWNKFRNVESGGISSDSIFNSLEGRNKLENNEARLTEAFGSYAQNQFKVVQYFRPGQAPEDSTKKHDITRFTNQFYLKSIFGTKRTEFEDYSPDSSYYGLQLSAFKDSFSHRRVSNEVGYMIKLKPLKLNIGIEHSYNSIFNNGDVSQFNNVYLNGGTRLSIKDIDLVGAIRFGVLGYNQGDYNLNASLGTSIKNVKIKGGILSQLVEPNFMEKSFYSNAIVWNNSFDKTSLNQLFGDAAILLNNHSVAISVNAETVKGLIYFASDNTPNQHNDFVSLVNISGKYKFSTNYFGSAVKVTFLNSSNQSVLPRPSYSAQANVYTQFRLFSKKLKLQLGAKSFWFSDFNSPVYNPYTRQWQIGTKSFEMYPPINTYVNARVKSFCFGIEFFHTQMGLMGSTYYSSPSYPIMPRKMRLNIRWDLLN
ncbi:MAG: hypothetical protein HKP14_04545 [Bacteroidia bacterium]|nr:hypothetical protein [Bacteroidia bacterium]